MKSKMGCFPACACACFGHWKHKHVQHQPLPQREELQEADKVLDGSTESSIKEEEIASLLKFVAQSQGEDKQQMYGCNRSTSSGANMVESENGSVKNKKENEDYSMTGEECLHQKDKMTSDDDPKVSNRCSGGTSNDVIMLENENGTVKNKIDNEGLIMNPAASKGPEDFLIIDTESVQSKEKMTLDDDPKRDDDIKDFHSPVRMESSESLFSLSIDSRKHASTPEMGEREVSSGPVKLLESSSYDDKENVNIGAKWNMLPYSKKGAAVKQHGSQFDEVIAVDTSLSSWLGGSEKTPPCKASCGSSPDSEKNYGEAKMGVARSPAAAAELKGGCIACSSDDKQPGLGTVGRYWQQTSVAGQ